MDLDLTPQELAFREEVLDFLRQNLTPELAAGGAAMTSVFCDPRYSLPWQRILHARGWAAPSWPEAYGGPGWSVMQRAIFAAECAKAGAPALSPMGLKMVGPAIMGHGSPEQKAFFLPRILSGEDYWCQGYSEPGSGSDLASLQLSAVSDGDDYILNGSKIWTTHAHFANRMFCLVRTSREGRPQQGITFLLLEMASPGISVEPIITMAGEHEVNQVFFDNVRVPKAGRVGAEDQGWTVAKYLLEFERGGAWTPGLSVGLDRAQRLAEDAFGDDPDHRRRLAEAQIAMMAIDMTERRVLSELADGRNPGPASSLLKIRGTEALQQIDEASVLALGPYAAVDPSLEVSPNQGPVGPEEGRVAVARFLNNRAATIYGGSNEIQRDIIAKLVLRL